MYPEIAFDDQGFNKFTLNGVAQIQDGKTIVVWPEQFAVAQPVWPVLPWSER
jgi:hypothetical protein